MALLAVLAVAVESPPVTGSSGYDRVAMLSRRRFLQAVSASLLAGPLPVNGQQTKTLPVIGFLGNQDAHSGAPQAETFTQGLRELNWIEGKTVRIEYRWVDGKTERAPQLAAELVHRNVDVLVVSGPFGVRAGRAATKVIPIVVAALLTDPVRGGFVTSLARPGGNITGIVSQYEDLLTKQVEILSEVVPKLARLFVLRHTSSPPVTAEAVMGAAASVGIKSQILEVGDPAHYETAFRTARNAGGQAMHVLPSPIFAGHRSQLADLAARYRLPAMYEFGEYVKAGGLLSYGPSILDMYRKAASYVDRILKGAKPGDLPMERPAKFELVINLKTARALGLTIPPSLMLRADQVIE